MNTCGAIWKGIGMSRILAHGHSFVSVKTFVHILEPNSGNNIPVAYPRSHNNNYNNLPSKICTLSLEALLLIKKGKSQLV